MGEEVRVRYDAEGDYLEVLFARTKGYFRETDHDAVMEKLMPESWQFGRIVWAEIADANGFPRLRPVVIVTPSDRIG